MKPLYRSMAAGDIIYQAKDDANSVFLIHTGEVDIFSHKDFHLATLKEGEMFGEIGQILKEQRTVTVMAKTNCIIRVIEDDVLSQKIEGTDPAVLAILRGLALRLNETNKRTEALWTELQVYKSLK